ncbi:apolipoprotein N-acyltransferase, partial [Streptomyces clavuligerus]
MQFTSGVARSARRSAAAVVAGALPVLAFPEPSLWWWAFLALVPWMLLLRTAPTGRRAAVEGWLGGLGFIVAVHHWLIPSLHVFTVVLGALLGLLWAPWGLLVRSLLRGPGPGRALAALVVLPSGWLLIELIRSWEGLGGPWGLLGAAEWRIDPALRLASLGGVWLLSLLVVAVNTAVTEVVALPRTRTAVVCAAVLGAVLVTAGAAGAPRPGEAGRARIALVQPGVFDGPDGADRRFARAEELTRTLAGRDPDLVVWGESSVGADLGQRPDLAARLAALSRAVGADLLVNVDARRTGAGGGGIFKSAVLVGPQGPTGERYDKMRLVPFGEYVPARGLLGWATSVGKAAAEDRSRGTRPVVLTLSGARPRVGPLVCFESAFPDMGRRLVRDGADLLVVQSATSTFQSGWAPEQHASLAALRAAETGRPVAHATLTGVSAVHGADGGRIGPALSTETSAAAVYEVPLVQGMTAYVRLGNWSAGAALIALSAWGAAGGGLRLIRRADRGQDTDRG